MKKSKEITKQYLLSALNNASDFNMMEVRHHIKQALNKIDTLQSKQQKREETNHSKEWWKNIVAGTVKSPITPTTGTTDVSEKYKDINQLQLLSLQHLDQMIQEEKDKLANKKDNIKQQQLDNDLLIG